MKRMFSLGFVIIIILFIVSCGGSEEKVVATVGDHQILLPDYEDRYTDFLASTGSDDNYRTRIAILNNMINEILLLHYDDNRSVYENEEYQREVDWTWKQALLAYLKDQEVYANLVVTDEEMRKAFEMVNEKVAARHLYAKTEEEANNLYNLLQSGSDFDMLAKQVFSDSVLQNNGGYVGYFTWGDMDPGFEDAAYSMDIGEISKPVKTAYGYSIIKVEDRKPHPLLTEYEYQKKKSHLERTLKIRKKKPAEQEFIKSVFDDKKLSYKDNSIKALVEEFGKTYKSMETSEFTKDAEVCAKYDNDEITSEEIYNFVQNLPAYHRFKIDDESTLKILIKGYIIQEILLDLAEEKGYDENKYVKKTYEQMKNNVYLKYKKSAVAEMSAVPDSTLQEWYKMHLDYFATPNEINVQEILVEDKLLAADINDKISNGSDFSELAREYSVRQWSAENGGELGFAPLSKFGIFKNDFWNADVLDVIGPVEIDGLYGIFKILGKKESEPLPFENINPLVLEHYKNNRKNDLLYDHLNKLSSKADIEVNEKVLRSMTLEKYFN
ncbi:MAG: peptidylprolyl isomerase [Melioribacteraceae bacterium]|nr:peptidylprolyl isomerase [Melioribacteraceae bacterium]MCF8395189.1 peptidylprolyl isomerase [Melioribacteraceae bacterium]MCF8420033.1 peptidylprolyl isomerase [Melioribacteraceae bacterium]